jgi:hypothetical protein
MPVPVSPHFFILVESEGPCGSLTKPAKNRIALAPTIPQYPPMLARVLSAAVNGIEAFPVEVEVNSGWGDTLIVIVGLPTFSPTSI